MRTVIAVLAVTLSAGAFVRAESLGEVAEREKEKHKGQKEGQVITETELANAKGRNVSVTYANGSAAPAPAAKDGDKDKGGDKAAAGDAKDKPKTPEELRAEKEKDWRDRLDKANAEVSAAQAKIAELEATPNLYSNAAATSQLAGQRAALAAAQGKVADLQEEGRRGFY
jgi:cytoskeletal protein RodZ